MAFFRNLSIKSKLTVTHLLVIFCTLGGGFSFVIVKDLRTFRAHMVDSNMTIAQAIGDYTVSDLAFNDKTEAERTLQTLKNIPVVEFACLYDEKGKLFASFSPHESTPSIPTVQPEMAEFRGNALHIFRPIYYEERFYGTIYLRVSTRSLAEKIRDYLYTMTMLVSSLLLLAYVMVGRLQRFISGPITALTDTAKSISAQPDYSIRVKKKSEDETGLLCDAFNSMLDQIEQRVVERNRATRALEASEEKYRELVDNMLDVVFALDAAGNIVFTSPSMKALFGYLPEEIEGRWINEFTHPEDQPRIKSLFPDLLKGQETPLEFRIVTKTGDIRWVRISSRPVLREEEPAGITGSMTDITESKRLQEQLQQAQKMEAIGTLAGGIAHDFNNILTAIIGYTELSLLDINENTRARSNLEQVLDAGARAKALVSQILTFSRQSKQERKPVILQAIVKEAITFLKATLPSTINIVQEIQKKQATVTADSTQIHQVLMNLCTNAAHAMAEKGGVLFVGLEEQELKEGETSSDLDFKPGRYAKIIVRDSGHGMDQGTLDKIFDPFFTTKKPGSGTGMGLSVVHGIVRSHGGYINVSSEPNQGSEFQVLLPLLPDEPRAETVQTRPLPHGQGRVLFIDDEPPLAELAQQMLESLGYETIVKTNSLDALELFQQNPAAFDVVVTDMTMPKMTGLSLARELVDIRSDIPIILCTGFSEAIHQDAIQRAGIREVLMKPIPIRDLGEALKRAMGREALD